MAFESEVVYGLGTSKQGAISLHVHIGSDTYESIIESLGLISDLAPSFHYSLVERNFHDLESIRQFTVTTLTLGRQFGRPDHMKLWQTLMTSTVNWLASMKLYLDYEQTRLTRSFGRTSQQLAGFITSTQLAFDGKPGYRFASKFRNFVLHCGLPHSTISVREDASKTIGASATIVIDRDELLRGYDEWGKAKPDIEAMDQKFDPSSLFAEAMEGVRDVQRAVLGLRLDEALKGLQPILHAIETVDEWGRDGRPTVLKATFVEGQPKDFVPTVVPVELVRQLAAIAEDTESVRHELFTELSAPSRPPLSLDPEQLRQGFQRDSRAVEAILTWLAEGGTTDVFRDAVDQIIKDDGDGMPLVGGLIHLSATLAHMTSATLNMSPEALLAGLVNVYTQADPSI